MTGLRITGVVVSILVLAAHFLRSGHPLLVLVLLLAPLLLVTGRPWALRILQLVLLLGALEWSRTLILLAAARLRAGEPFLRMALILAAVTAVTLLSAKGLSRLGAPADGERTASEPRRVEA